MTRHAVAAIIRRNRDRDEPQPAAGLSPRTVQMIHGILTKAFNDAMRWNRIYRNPAAAAIAPSGNRTLGPTQTTWTADDLDRFWTFLGDNRYRYPWMFTATSGARRGEVLGLRWQDLDLERGTATIINQITTDRDQTIVFKHATKTGRGHVISLDPATIELFHTWQQIQNEEKRLLRCAYTDYEIVFPAEDGIPYNPDRYSREFIRKQEQHNTAHPDTALPRLTIHGLRHTWATIALAENVPLEVVSERLNHSTTHITAEVYSHVTPPIARDAADRIGEIILGPDVD